MFVKFLNLLKQYDKTSFTILVHNWPLSLSFFLFPLSFRTWTWRGGFDGLYLFKYLTKVLSFEVDALIDNNNKFIQITYKKIKFIDSYRMFPIKLDDLAKVFNVPGKTSQYNNKFNDFSLFKDHIFRGF